MPTNILKNNLYKALGLTYEQLYRSSQLTADPSVGQLDVQAFIDQKDRCFRSLDKAKIQHKKTLILSAWYFQNLNPLTNQSTLDIFIQFFNELIDDGFTIYTSGPSGLIKITDTGKIALRSQLQGFTPITTKTAQALAAKLQLSSEHTEIINMQRLHDLAKSLKEYQVDEYTDKQLQYFCDNGGLLPIHASPKQLQCIENAMDPDDQVIYSLQNDTAELLSTKLQRHIYALRIDRNTADILKHHLEKVTSLCANLKTLFIDDYINSEQLSVILCAAPNLETIHFSHNGMQFADPALLNLAGKTLKALKKISANRYPFTIEQLAMIFNAAPQLETIDLHLWSIKPEASFNLSTGQLKHLKQLLLNGSFSSEQLSNLILAAPFLETIRLGGVKFDTTPLNLSPENINYLRQFDLRMSNITANQLATILNATSILETMDISDCTNIGNDPIHLNPKQLQHLLAFNANRSSITSEQLTVIITAAANLEILDIGSCNNASKALPRLTPNQLDKLILFKADRTEIKAEQLSNIMTAAPNLETINIEWCRHIGQTLFHLNPKQLNQLLVLNASHSSITSAQLSEIFEAAPHLETVELLDCKNINDALLKLKPNQLSHLKKMSFAPDLPNKPLGAILMAAPHLEEISFVS